MMDDSYDMPDIRSRANVSAWGSLFLPLLGLVIFWRSPDVLGEIFALVFILGPVAGVVCRQSSAVGMSEIVIRRSFLGIRWKQERIAVSEVRNIHVGWRLGLYPQKPRRLWLVRLRLRDGSLVPVAAGTTTTEAEELADQLAAHLDVPRSDATREQQPPPEVKIKVPASLRSEVYPYGVKLRILIDVLGTKRRAVFAGLLYFAMNFILMVLLLLLSDVYREQSLFWIHGLMFLWLGGGFILFRNPYRPVTLIAAPHCLEIHAWNWMIRGPETVVPEGGRLHAEAVEGRWGHRYLRISNGARVWHLGGWLPDDEARWLATTLTRAVAGQLDEVRRPEPIIHKPVPTHGNAS